MFSHASRSGCRGFSALKVLLGVLAFVGALTVAWVVLLPSLVVSTIRSKTGFVARVESLRVNPFTARVHVRGLVVENPADWPEKSFLELRELHADAELLPLLRGHLVADDVTIDLPRLTLVRDRQGAMNALVLKERLIGPAAPKSPEPAGSASPAPGFLIRKLTLRCGELAYVDHSGRKPVSRRYALNLSQELRDVDSVADLAVPFKGAAFGLVSDLAAGLTGDPAKLVQDAGALWKDTQQKAGEALKGLLEKTKP
jgi:uncharacterized protein involved in outer membrane biogenesis